MANGKREYGTGTVYQRADGMWIGRVEAGRTAKGSRRRFSDKDKDKCKAKMREVAADDIAALATTKTVKRWADEWLPMHQERVRSNVFVTDRGHVMKWIVPTIGTRRLSELTPADAREIEMAIVSAGRSTSTARGAISVLRTMLKNAKVEGYRVPGGIFNMERPKLARSDRDAIPSEQAKKLLRAADGTPDLARWMLALYQALRQGEALGLTRDRVELEEGTLAIAWQLQPLPTPTAPPAPSSTRRTPRCTSSKAPSTSCGLRWGRGGVWCAVADGVSTP